MPEEVSCKYSKKNWDEIRLKFATSLMIDTKLSSLAQNVELSDWPIKGEGETPAKYIDFSYEELMEIPGLAEKPQRIDLLIDILKETMAFDDPFGEMVDTVETATEKDDTIGKTLRNLEIPEDFPLRFGAIASETIDFCSAEGIETVGQFAKFSQDMAQSVVVGGDFKALLNALISGDEDSIATYLPFRKHYKGLHVEEALGLLVGQLSDNERYSLLKKYGKKITIEQSSKARLSKEQIARLETILDSRADDLVRYFKSDVAQIRSKVQSGTTMERVFVVLDDEEAEVICAVIMKKQLKYAPSLSVKADETKKKGGFFSRLFGKG